MTERVKEWTAQHLPWLTVALVGLWLPPLAWRIAVNVGLSADRGHPALTDPATILTAAELVLMMTAVPRLMERDVAGWKLLVWSRLAVLAQTVWTILVYTRLNGLLPTLRESLVIEAIAGLLLSAYVLVSVRPVYD